MAQKRITDLTEAPALDGGELVELSKPSATVTITAATISASAADNSFNDSGNGFGAFAAGDRVIVTGFATGANNLFVGTLTAATAGKLTIGGTDGDVIVDEAAGASVTISKWVSERTTAQAIADLGGGGGGGGIEEAPEDGNTYGRKDAAWEQIASETVAGEPVPFVGARMGRAATYSMGSPAALPLTTEEYDYGGWHDNATNNTRMTVPAGVTKVRITGQFAVQSPTNTSFQIRKNGLSTQQGTVQVDKSGYTFSVYPLVTGVLEVTPGDYFEVWTEGTGTITVDRTYVSIEAVNERVIASDLSADINTRSGTTYTLAETDNNDIIEMSNAGANTVTIPANATASIPVGAMFSIVQIGAGATTVQAAAGVTLNGLGEGAATLTGQWAGVSLYKRATDAWVIQGEHGGVS